MNIFYSMRLVKLMSLVVFLSLIQPVFAKQALPRASHFESEIEGSSLAASSIEEGQARFRVMITGYSSTPEETDDTPFITANGTYVHDGVAAANFLPFDTHFMIPELFGTKVFVVKDRMHRRFSNRVDIWFPAKQQAKRFGVARAEIVIVGGAPSRYLATPVVFADR